VLPCMQRSQPMKIYGIRSMHQHGAQVLQSCPATLHYCSTALGYHVMFFTSPHPAPSTHLVQRRQ
jgi:hypothetical protein